ncbi:MAG: hypothetical protein RIS47_1265, partial [Bacteroidota bacterium]
MYVTVLSSHSYWAYITIVLVFASVVVALYSWLAGKSFTRLHRKLALYAFIAIHIQVTVGVVLYFLSPIVQAAFQDFGAAMRDQNLRLYAVEHPLSMIIAMALFTVGYVGL